MEVKINNTLKYWYGTKINVLIRAVSLFSGIPLITTTPDVRALSRKATLLCPKVAFLVQIYKDTSIETKISFPNGGLHRGVPPYYIIIAVMYAYSNMCL